MQGHYFLLFLVITLHVSALRVHSDEEEELHGNLTEDVEKNEVLKRPVPYNERKSYNDISLVDDVAVRATDWLEQSLGGKQMSDVMNIQRNSNGDDIALRSSMIINVSLLCICVAIFSCLRYRFPLVYANNVCQRVNGLNVLPAPHDSFFGWVIAAANVSDEQVMDTAGLDALMFIEFLRMFRRFLLYAGTLTAAVLCPIHYCLSDDASSDLLSAVGIGSVIHADTVPTWFFWVHAILVWCIIGLALHCVFDTNARFLKFRFKWLMMVPEPRSTTLMVENIPRSHCSDEALRKYFVHLFSVEAIERAYVVRRTPHLFEKVKKLKAAEESLLSARQAWAKEGYDPARAPTVKDVKQWQHRGENAIEFYTDQVQVLQEAVVQERQRVEQAVCNQDPNVISNAGFVTFTSRRWCRLASREQYREDTRQLVVRMPPDPADVLYHDFTKDTSTRWGSDLMANLCVVLIMFFWAPAVAITSSLTSLDALRDYVPWIEPIVREHPRFKTLLQGLLATLALKFLMSMLPTLLMGVIRQFLTLKSGAWAQLKLQGRLFSFEIFFTLFIVTLGSSISSTVKSIVDRPQTAAVILATSLPTASHFYLNYVILGWFTVALELSRYWNCLMFLCHKPFWDPETARQKAEPEDQDYYGMGARMARAALMGTLALVFMQVLPIIGWAAWIFFGISSIFYSYLVVFAETKKPDLGGEFWVQSHYHIFFALIVFVVLMTGTLGLKPEGRFAAFVTASSFLLLFAAWQRLKQFSWEILPFETVAEMDYASARHIGKVRRDGMYIQPECKAGPGASSQERRLCRQTTC